MKNIFFLLSLLLYSLCGIGQSSEQLSKPKFGVSFNVLAARPTGGAFELNGHFRLSNNSSLFAGHVNSVLGVNGLRFGVLREFDSQNNLSFNMGLGVRFDIRKYPLSSSRGITREVKLEIPIELQFKLSDPFTLHFGFRPNYSLAREANTELVHSWARLHLIDNIHLGVKYSFGKQ